MTAAAVAAKVYDGTMTSSPSPIPSARYARCSAAVHDDTASACLTPKCAANFSSSSAIRGPMVSQPERRVSVTAAMSSSEISRSNSGIWGRSVTGGRA
jgi:hypothetical protein